MNGRHELRANLERVLKFNAEFVRADAFRKLESLQESMKGVSLEGLQMRALLRANLEVDYNANTLVLRSMNGSQYVWTVPRPFNLFEFPDTVHRELVLPPPSQMLKDGWQWTSTVRKISCAGLIFVTTGVLHKP